MMRFVLPVLIMAGQVVGINPDEVRKTQNFVKACHNFIKKGSYPASNDFSDHVLPPYNWTKEWLVKIKVE